MCMRRAMVARCVLKWCVTGFHGPRARRANACASVLVLKARASRVRSAKVVDVVVAMPSRRRPFMVGTGVPIMTRWKVVVVSLDCSIAKRLRVGTPTGMCVVSAPSSISAAT